VWVYYLGEQAAVGLVVQLDYKLGLYSDNMKAVKSVDRKDDKKDFQLVEAYITGINTYNSHIF